jgi:hypothetical protein
MTTRHGQGNHATRKGQATEADGSVIAPPVGRSSGERLASETPSVTRGDDRRAIRRAQMPARVQSAISDHKYEVGQVVNFTPGKMNRESSPGPYQIVRHLPPDGSENQYRVKSIEEGYERVVHESQLG